MINELRISRQDIALIEKELEARKPYEGCGILIGVIHESTAQIDEVMPMCSTNRSRLGFELDARDFYTAWNYARKIGKEVVGIYHTHPAAPAIPSLGDKMNMGNFPSVWIIAGVDGLKAYIWDDGVKNVKITENFQIPLRRWTHPR